MPLILADRAFPLPRSPSQDDGDVSDDDLAGLGSDDEAPLTHEQHMADLKALAERDPDFFKYLQENDAELLDFDPEAGAGGDESDEEDEEEEEDSEGESEGEVKGKKGKGKEKEKERVAKPTPVLTNEILKKWQRSLLDVNHLDRILPHNCFADSPPSYLTRRPSRSAPSASSSSRSARWLSPASAATPARGGRSSRPRFTTSSS